MLDVVICGTGNLAVHLFKALKNGPEVKVVQVVGRNTRALEYFVGQAETVTDLDKLARADIYILAISDNAIEEYAGRLEAAGGLLVHTSGSMPISSLPENGRRGVFYPLQTFSKELEVDFRKIPICLEAEEEEDYGLLNILASAISDKVVRIDSQQRAVLHTAAVFVNNFTNHLYHIGHSLCDEKGVDFELLHELIRETASKVEHLSPLDAQTGPARRGDTITMEKQLNMLETETFSDVYKTISKSIEKTYGEKL